MSTLATLKAAIADDLARSDLTDAIASAISDAIRYYQKEHFFFNETRALTFTCVVGQARYDGTDDADIPKFIDIDQMSITIGSNNYPLRYMTPEHFEILNDGNVSNGQPFNYTHYNRKIGLYVPPDSTYTVRFMGSYMYDAPATDAEADNEWMLAGYPLIRQRAKWDLLVNKIRDFEYAQQTKAFELDELNSLRVETSRRAKTDRVTPTQW